MTENSRAQRCGLALGAAVFALLGGCGTPPNQFFIVQNQVEKEGCRIDTDRTVYRPVGQMDVRLVQPGASAGYVVFPLLQNDLPEEESGPQQNRIVLKSFIVDLEPITSLPPGLAALFEDIEANDPSLLHFREATSGSVGPGGDLIAGSVVAISAELARRIRDVGELKTISSAQLGARIRAVGSRGTGDIESDEFFYPIEICDGCLIARVDSCPFTSAPNMGNACNVAQDGIVDCCTMGSTLLCPPPVATP
jgi:hypothetical protein